MTLVVIESPYGKNVDGTPADDATLARNVRYLRAAIGDSLERGEAPFASHGLYPGTLNDRVPEQRRLGMEAGFAWGRQAHRCVVYTDLGVTPGMAEGIERAQNLGIPVELRRVKGWTA
jgi:hypothetical protein